MDFSNLDGFCKRLGNNGFLNTSTIIDELIVLKEYVFNIKIEVTIELTKYNGTRNDLLQFIISRIKSANYSDDINYEGILKCYRIYGITPADVLNNENIRSTNFRTLISTVFLKQESAYDRDDSYAIQYDYYIFFCKYFANDLIDFLKSKVFVNKGFTKEDTNTNYKLELNLINAFTTENINTNNNLELNLINTFTTEDLNTNNNLKLNYIFKSFDTLQIFIFLLNKFFITKETSSKRGVQAKLNAIWCCPSSKNKIFREHTELKDYIEYLNESFNLKYNSRTMSDGYKYHITIQKWLIE